MRCVCRHMTRARKRNGEEKEKRKKEEIKEISIDFSLGLVFTVCASKPKQLVASCVHFSTTTQAATLSCCCSCTHCYLIVDTLLTITTSVLFPFLRSFRQPPPPQESLLLRSCLASMVVQQQTYTSVPWYETSHTKNQIGKDG